MRTKTFAFALIPSLAVMLALSGCGDEKTQSARICKDKDGFRVDDSKCQQFTSTGNGGQVQQSSGSAFTPFLWYYLGRNSYVPSVGQHFTTSTVGSTYPSTGTVYSAAPRTGGITLSGTAARGGFGSSYGASSYGGGFGG